VQDEDARGLDGTAHVQAHRARGAFRVHARLLEQRGERRVRERTIEHETHGALGVVADHEDHRADEARILQVVGGDQELAGEIGALRARGGQRGRRRRQHEGAGEDADGDPR